MDIAIDGQVGQVDAESSITIPFLGKTGLVGIVLENLMGRLHGLHIFQVTGIICSLGIVVNHARSFSRNADLLSGFPDQQEALGISVKWSAWLGQAFTQAPQETHLCGSR